MLAVKPLLEQVSLSSVGFSTSMLAVKPPSEQVSLPSVGESSSRQPVEVCQTSSKDEIIFFKENLFKIYA